MSDIFNEIFLITNYSAFGKLTQVVATDEDDAIDSSMINRSWLTSLLKMVKKTPRAELLRVSPEGLYTHKDGSFLKKSDSKAFAQGESLYIAKAKRGKEMIIRTAPKEKISVAIEALLHNDGCDTLVAVNEISVSGVYVVDGSGERIEKVKQTISGECHCCREFTNVPKYKVTLG